MRITLALVAALMVFGCSRPEKQSASSEEGSTGRVVLQNKGSDTLVNVAQAWAEAYKEVEPNTAIAVTGGGSGTGISSLINGTVDLANSSRKMKEKEIALARERGIQPKEHVVGFDALAIFLHPNNPIEGMTLAQLSGIYGEGGTIDKWSQLGVKVPGCPSDEIVRVSRQNNSGTYVYFKDAVLGQAGDLRMGSRDMHGSKDVVDLVEHTPCAIGYSGLAYANEHIKMPCISTTEGAPCVKPEVETALDGSYPIARPLFMYTAGAPKGATKAYLEWIMTPKAQCIIQEKGYAPAKKVSCEP